MLCNLFRDIEGGNPDEELDTHRCARCKMVFTSLNKYVKHKLSQDNCKVVFQRACKTLIPQIKQIGQKQDDKKKKPAVETKRSNFKVIKINIMFLR